MSYDNTNRGQIWGNEKKSQSNQPDFKGDINVDGVEYWISAWKRNPDANPRAPALSISLQKKDANKGMQQEKNVVHQSSDGIDDDLIPF